MEEWQLEHIEKNGVMLLKCIYVDECLLEHFSASGILTDDDKDKIKKKGTKSSKASELLSILKTRPSFDLLVDALQKQRQGGAVAILENHPMCRATKDTTVPLASEMESKLGQPVEVGDLFGGLEYIFQHSIPGEMMSDIVRRMSEHWSIELCIERWEDLAVDLRISEKGIIRLRKKQTDRAQLLKHMLSEWKSEKSEAATWTTLLSTFVQNGLNDMAVTLVHIYEEDLIQHLIPSEDPLSV